MFDEGELEINLPLQSQIKQQKVLQPQDSHANVLPQKSKSHKIIGRFQENNEQNLIKQNQLYIGHRALQRKATYQNMEIVPSFVSDSALAKTKIIRQKVKNKKNLFDSDSSDNDNDKQNKNIEKQDEADAPIEIKKQNQPENDNENINQQKFQIIEEEKEQDSNIKTNIFNIEEQAEINNQNQLTQTQITSLAISKIKIQIEESSEEEKKVSNLKLKLKRQRKQQSIQKQGKLNRKQTGKLKKKVTINIQNEVKNNNRQFLYLSKTLFRQQSLSLQQNALSIKRLLYEPIKKDSKFFFKLKRIKKSFSQSYQLYLQGNKEPILHCKNKLGSIGGNYYISLTKDMDKKSLAFMGKIRGNALGSEYTIYDSGLMPADNVQRKQWRTTMGKIRYETNIFGVNGPRKMYVFLPKSSTLEQFDTFKFTPEQQYLFPQSQACQKYLNKQPKWIKSQKSFGLNFGPRVKSASIKNFILIQQNIFIQEEGQQNIPNNLIFGKIKDNSFSLEVGYPLSILQAFGICVSQFDRKISCQ